MWYYVQSEPGLWTVGHGEGVNWTPDSDHESPEAAAKRVRYLNGGTLELSDIGSDYLRMAKSLVGDARPEETASIDEWEPKMNTAKVRNWHKRNTSAAIDIPVNVAVHTQADPRWEPYAQIYLRRQDGQGILTITLTSAEYLALKAQIENGAKVFE